MKYKYIVWCPDCYGVDFLGCFDGGEYESEEVFDTYEDAEKAAKEFVKGSIWEYKIVEVDEEADSRRIIGEPGAETPLPSEPSRPSRQPVLEPGRLPRPPRPGPPPPGPRDRVRLPGRLLEGGDRMSEKKDVFELLARPFAPHELGAVVVGESQSESGHYVTLKASISRELMEKRLDEAGAWQWELLRIEPVEIKRTTRDGRILTDSVFLAHGRLSLDGVTRDGVGIGTRPDAAASLAFKDAARKFGVGRYLRIERAYSVRLRVEDEWALRRVQYGNPTWEEALALLRGQSSSFTPAPSPSPRKREEEEVIPFEKMAEEPWHVGLRTVLKAKGLTEDWALAKAAELGYRASALEELSLDAVNAILRATRDTGR